MVVNDLKCIWRLADMEVRIRTLAMEPGRKDA